MVCIVSQAEEDIRPSNHTGAALAVADQGYEPWTSVKGSASALGSVVQRPRLEV